MDDAAAIVHAVPAQPSEIPDLASSSELFVEAGSAKFHGVHAACPERPVRDLD